jgi:hypothetical protein
VLRNVRSHWLILVMVTVAFTSAAKFMRMQHRKFRRPGALALPSATADTPPARTCGNGRVISLSAALE